MDQKIQKEFIEKVLAKAAEAIPIISRILKGIPEYCNSRNIDPDVIESMKIEVLNRMIGTINNDLQDLALNDSEKHELTLALLSAAVGVQVSAILQTTHYSLLELIAATKGQANSTDN